MGIFHRVEFSCFDGFQMTMFGREIAVRNSSIEVWSQRARDEETVPTRFVGRPGCKPNAIRQTSPSHEFIAHGDRSYASDGVPSECGQKGFDGMHRHLIKPGEQGALR